MSRLGISLLILISALWALPVKGADAVEPPILNIEKFVLPNGLQVLLHEDHTTPMAAVNIWYHVGSKNEKPGRTGFAHLFEHMMFQGSVHHDQDYFLPLQKIGGQVNGSTNNDRTNYWENVPSDYLKLALFLEADRMGWLLPALTQEKFDNQRDVVKNEKRQGESKPYARAREVMHRMLFPEGHPYRWLTIGSMADLSAASKEDVSEFFARYYTPNNASLCVVGDFDRAEVKAWIHEYFGEIPPGPALERLTAWHPVLDSERRAVLEDNVERPRLLMAWHTPGYYAAGDAEFDLLGLILSGGKTSRLYQKLVYELRIAQDVRAYQASRELSGVFEIRVTAAAGHTLAEIEEVLDTELAQLLAKGVSEDEVALAVTDYEASFIRGLQRMGGRGGKADRLNRYNVFAGDPHYLSRDFARFHEADRKSVNHYLRTYLGSDNRAVLHIVPQGDWAASPAKVDRTLIPGSTGGGAFVPPEIQQTTLPNGLKILLVEKHDLPLVEMRLHIGSGWFDDPAGLAGVAALTADMLDEGVDGLDALELAQEVAVIGARLKTSSTFDGSIVKMDVLKNHLSRGLQLMGNVVLAPVFSETDFSRLRRGYLGREQREAGQRKALAYKELHRRCFGAGHPYAQSYKGSGTSESLDLVTQSDLLAFYDSHYRPGNAALIFVGDLDLAEAMARTEEVFGDWDGTTVPAVNSLPASTESGARLVVIDRPGAQQSYIAGGYTSLGRSAEDYLAMRLVNQALGGQFSSRINLNLREDKGFTYSARSEQLALKKGGLFLVGTGVETGVTREALQELIAEMNAMGAERPLVGDELQNSRNSLVLGFPQQFQTYAGVAASLGDLVHFDQSLDSWQTFATRVAAVSEDDIAGVVARHLTPDRMKWVIVGDWQVIGPGLAELGLGEIDVIDAR